MTNTMDTTAILDIQRRIEEESGIVLNEQNGHLLESKLVPILKTCELKSLHELHYKLCVLKDPQITTFIIESIVTNETFWFRDKALWKIMNGFALPQFIQKLKTGERNSIKIWSAACSYGQEPYSVAMCIDQFLKANADETIKLSHFEILATDISHAALQTAKHARYDSIAIERGLDEAYKHKYFRQEGKLWQLEPEIRHAIHFQQFNLVGSAYKVEQFDMILCRNVLIYFSEDNKKNIYKKLADALKPDGILLVGSSELIEDSGQNFKRDHFQNDVYFKKIMCKEGESSG